MMSTFKYVKNWTLGLILLIGMPLAAQDNTLQLEDLDPSKFDLDFTYYDQSTAIFLAQLSALVYYEKGDLDVRMNILRLMYPESDIRYAFLKEPDKSTPLGENASSKRKKSNTQSELMFFGTKDFAVIVYRGSYSVKDWRTDLRMSTVGSQTPKEDSLYRGLPKGHEGFRQSLENLMVYENLFDRLEEFIGHYTKDVSSFPVYLTGHSLGAALATLTIKPLTYGGQFKFGGCYTFAPAMTVACDATDVFEEESFLIHNIVNYVDLITRANYKKLAHVGNYYRLSKYDKKSCTEDDGLLYAENERVVPFKFGESLNIFGNVLLYHRLDSYIERLRLPANREDKVKERGVDQSCFVHTLNPKKNRLPCLSKKEAKRLKKNK